MKAHEARIITDNFVHTDRMKTYMDTIHRRIQKAAEAGGSEINHPFFTLDPHPTVDQQNFILWQLKEDGYEVILVKNPDPCRPGTDDYYKVRW